MKKSQSRLLTTFRCPAPMRDAIDKTVAELVYSHSTKDRTFRYTRTDFILDLIQKWYHSTLIEEVEVYEHK